MNLAVRTKRFSYSRTGFEAMPQSGTGSRVPMPEGQGRPTVGTSGPFDRARPIPEASIETLRGWQWGAGEQAEKRQAVEVIGPGTVEEWRDATGLNAPEPEDGQGGTVDVAPVREAGRQIGDSDEPRQNSPVRTDFANPMMDHKSYEFHLGQF